MEIGVALLLVLCMIVLVVLLTIALHPFYALWIAGLIVGMAGGLSPDAALHSLQRGFGETVGKVGVIIVSGSVIG